MGLESNVDINVEDEIIYDNITILQYPLDKNQILLRLENLDDSYTNPSAASTRIDLHIYLDKLWKKANKHSNPDLTYQRIKISERSLSGN